MKKMILFLCMITAIFSSPFVNATEYPVRIETEDIIYELEEGDYQFSAVDLTRVGRTKSLLTIDSGFYIDGKFVNVGDVKFKSENVSEIIFTNLFPSIVDPYDNTPNLSVVTYKGDSPHYYTEDGIFYSKVGDSVSDFIRLELLPPAKKDECLYLPDGINAISLKGNRYVKVIYFPSSVTQVTMSTKSSHFPELGEIRVSDDNDTLCVLDGALYSRSGNGSLSFIYFPTKYSDTFFVNEKTTSLAYWPDVKNIIIDSPFVSLRGNKFILGSNVESLEFTKPSNSDWPSGAVRYYSSPDERGSIYGENLRRVVLPPNVGFSPSKFAIFELIKSEAHNSGTKYWATRTYKVSYPEKLEYVEGGWLVGGYYDKYTDSAYIGIQSETYSGAFNDVYRYECDNSTAFQSDNRWIYPSNIEFHLSGYHTYDVAPADFNRGHLQIYYDNIQHSLTDVSKGAHGLKVDWMPIESKGLGDFRYLRSLDIYFPDNFSGFGTNHLGNIFTAKVSYMPQVVQYNEDGTTSTLRRPENLIHIGLYGNVEYIPYGFFSNFISLESVVLPESLYVVGDKAFYGCSKLNELSVYSSYPPVVYDDTFGGVRANMTHLLVPQESVELYRNDVHWRNFFVEAIDAGPLSIKKSILEAGDVQYEFSGQYGATASLKVMVNSGYTFVGWYDKNLKYLGSSEELILTIVEPTVVNAVFFPTGDSDYVSYEWLQNGTLAVSVPADSEVANYRISCYSGLTYGTPVLIETFSKTDLKARLSASTGSADLTMTIPGLLKNQDYSVVVECLDENMNALRAYLKSVQSYESYISNLYEDTAIIKLDGRNLRIDSATQFSASAFTARGQKLFDVNERNSYEADLPAGLIIVMVNSTPYKLIVQ